jgi:short-subunit dehydrogenase
MSARLAFPTRAILTGATGALGRKIAHRLAREGTALVLVARGADALEALAAELRAGGGRAVALPADLRDLAALEGVIARSVAALGGLDLLVNNAGIETFGHYHEASPEEIAETVALNLTAPLVLSRHAVVHMRAHGGGAIVHMASTAGLVGTPWGAVYAATKSGLLAATSSLRMEYGAEGIHTSVICPGFVDDSGMHDEHRRHAGAAPRFVGTTTTAAVAEAVVRAIRTNASELIVNSAPFRPLLPLERLFPSFAERVLGVVLGGYMRKIADGKGRERRLPPSGD